MTATQVSYWTLQEDKRHNRVVESETKRHNLASEDETHRHNVAYETETNRHNVTTEQLTASQIAEQRRHNVATENLTATQIAEQHRHNVATENIAASQLAEQQRHNREQERISDVEAQTKVQELYVHMQRAMAQNKLDEAKADAERIKALVSQYTAAADIFKAYGDAVNTWLKPIQTILGGFVAKAKG